MTRLYCADMTNYPRYAIYYVPAPVSDLDRFGAQLLGYDAFQRRGPRLSGRHPAAGAGLARSDQRSPQIRFSCHAEGADVAGARQDRGRAARCLRRVRRNAPGDSGDPAGCRLDRGLYRGDPGGAAAATDPACGRLRQRIRFVPRAAHRSGSCAAKSLAIDAAAARASGPLGISLCDGRLPFPHDVDGATRRRAPRIRSWRC